MGNPSQSNLDTTGYSGSLDVFDTATPFDVLNFIVQSVLNKAVTCEAVIVKSVDTGKLTVTVQPAVNQIDGDGNATPHGTIYNVPYVRLQGGLAAAIVDPVAGDLGVMLICARDISSVKANKSVSNPGSFRRFDWADGLYLGGWFNPAPTTYVKISPGAITLTTPTNGTVTVNTGTANVNAQTKATVTAPEVDVISNNVNLGATGGQPVARVGDTVAGGVITSGSTKVKSA